MRSLLLQSVVTCCLMGGLVGAIRATEPPSGETPEAKGTLPEEKTVDAVPEVPGLEELEKAYKGTTPPESVRMLMAILRGKLGGSGDGWFGPALSRFGWEWLAKQHGMTPQEAISAEKFLGPPECFRRLDRNRDGKIAAEDLDWSDGNSWVQQAYLVNRLFRRMDPTGDGRLTRDEWLAFFDAAKNGKDYLGPEDLRDALLTGTSGGFLPGDAPSQPVLIRGLFAGEIGSLNEGPGLNDTAPDFSLKTHDGQETVRLSDSRGKPVVLVFGNFTCGPFRSMYPGVEEVYQRFKDEAAFLSVYVREAHPTDGWQMQSNDKAGVVAVQPKTYAERVAVAAQCHRLLKHSMPLLVDEINDPTGNAYSGMPARLYVIDHEGKVAYKGGRGPFGFKAGEMEQALVMLLLERKLGEQKP